MHTIAMMQSEDQNIHKELSLRFAVAVWGWKTRLTLICELIRYRLVQVRQILADFPVGRPVITSLSLSLSLSLSFFLFFVLGIISQVRRFFFFFRKRTAFRMMGAWVVIVSEKKSRIALFEFACTTLWLARQRLFMYCVWYTWSIATRGHFQNCNPWLMASREKRKEICSISSRSRVLAHRPCPKLEMFCPSVLQLFYGCSKVLMTNHGVNLRTGWRSELRYPSPWPCESGLTI